MDHQDLLYALACAANESGLHWDGKSVPKYTQLQSDYVPNSGIQTDRNGSTVTNSPSASAMYLWGPNTIVMGLLASKPELVHEATHYLQDSNGKSAGAAGSIARALIEQQAYAAQKNAPFDCMGWLGGWNPGLLSDRLK